MSEVRGNLHSQLHLGLKHEAVARGIKRPVEVSVSMALVRDMNFTARRLKLSSMAMRSRKLHPSRSSFHTISVSPGC